jgi:hypothetical protein
MRTAKALLASVPLAALLVAAVVVPIVVSPGAFRFHDWPSPTPPSSGVERIGIDAPLASAAPPRHARAVTARRSTRPALAARPRRPSRVAPAPARPTLADTTSPHDRRPPPESSPAPATTRGAAPPAPAAPPATKSPEPSASQASASGPPCGADGCDPGSGAASDPGPVTGTIALARQTACQLADCTR